jgi:hypothetical protein
MKFKWECPKCGAPANGCGTKSLECRNHGRHQCSGLICECDGETGPTHGEALNDPCEEARCYHCGWVGTHPVPPKGLQAWEKKAIAAGWAMPLARVDELKGAKR